MTVIIFRTRYDNPEGEVKSVRTRVERRASTYELTKRRDVAQSIRMLEKRAIAISKELDAVFDRSVVVKREMAKLKTKYEALALEGKLLEKRAVQARSAAGSTSVELLAHGDLRARIVANDVVFRFERKE